VAWLKNRTLSTSSLHLMKLFREIYLPEKEADEKKKTRGLRK